MKRRVSLLIFFLMLVNGCLAGRVDSETRSTVIQHVGWGSVKPRKEDSLRKVVRREMLQLRKSRSGERSLQQGITCQQYTAVVCAGTLLFGNFLYWYLSQQKSGLR